MAIVGLVSMRRILLKAAYRISQLIVSAGVAITAALSYKPQWVPTDVTMALENLRPAFGGSEQQPWLIVASALLLLGLPLIAYLDGARQQSNPQTPPRPEELGQALTVLADMSRFVSARDTDEPKYRMLKDYFIKPNTH